MPDAILGLVYLAEVLTKLLRRLLRLRWLLGLELALPWLIALVHLALGVIALGLLDLLFPKREPPKEPAPVPMIQVAAQTGLDV